jgi:hypothetical protein
METNQNLLNEDLQIDDTSRSYLGETAKWASFLAIVGFIGSVIIVILAFVLVSSLDRLEGYGSYSRYNGMAATTIMIVYIIIGVILFFLSLYLYRFADKMKTALQTADQGELNQSFMNLKSLYKMMGILTIIYLSFIVLGLLISVAGGGR